MSLSLFLCLIGEVRAIFGLPFPTKLLIFGFQSKVVSIHQSKINVFFLCSNFFYLVCFFFCLNLPFEDKNARNSNEKDCIFSTISITRCRG